jgi:hypothetical protein
MPHEKTHDLYEFMRQISSEMSAEYDRIQMRASEDPGTAGDQGEENWATLLRDWIPRTYEIVTKGRIISEKGETSPQIDVLILHGSYPRKLIDKKLYLAAGVAAAFECKTTLKAVHIADAVRRCTSIKNLYPERVGTPYKELHMPLVYGLLAHSHTWKNQGSTPEEHIDNELQEADASLVSHPRFQLDLVCVADLATWTAQKMTFIGPRQLPDDWDTMAKMYGPSGSAITAYIAHTRSSQQQVPQFTPIGVLISHLCQKLAWENATLRSLADYYRVTNIAGSGSGQMRRWPVAIYSEAIRPRIEAGHLSNGPQWDEWNIVFT